MRTLIALVLLCTCTLQAQDKYDLLVQKLKFKESAVLMAHKYIDLLVEEKKDIPAAKWEKVKSEIDYSNFLSDVKGVLQNNYTIKEVDDLFAANEMVADINDSGQFLYKAKETVTAQMYDVSKKFGRQINFQIRDILQKK